MKDESNSARRGPPVWVVIGFLLAFGATIVTVVLTGLFVRAPGAGAPDGDRASVRTERAESAVRNGRGAPAVENERGVPAVENESGAPAVQNAPETPAVGNERAAPAVRNEGAVAGQ